MKRYYLDRLNLTQSILKSFIANILITLFLVILYFITNLDFYFWYIYLLLGLYAIVLVVHILKANQKKSFYLADNTIVYCSKDREERIQLDNITMIEEYYGIDYLFGKKTIILHEKNKKHYFLFNLNKASAFRREIENAINVTGKFVEFNI